MRLDFRRRGRTFFHPRSEFQDVMAIAARDGGAGIDSLALLVATLEHPQGAALARKAGLDPVAIARAARAAPAGGGPGAGLTADARSVIEAAAQRSLQAGRDSGIGELLLALATSESRARDVLAASGVSLARLVAVVGGPPPA
jgi:hypothetical protein